MYSRKVDGKTLTFEHARFLYQRSFVLYDRETLSLWIHTTGTSVIGKQKGKTLKFLPSTVTTWKNWRKEHPQTLVLNVRKGKNPRFTLRKKPQDGGFSVGESDGDLKLYPLSILQKQRVINDELAGKKIVVIFDPDQWRFAAYERGKRTFKWKDGKLVDQTGTEWNLLKGSSGKEVLKPIPVVSWLTKAWKRFYPEGKIYSSK